MLRTLKDYWPEIVVGLVVLATLGFVVWGSFMIARAAESWNDWCTSQGGEILKDSSNQTVTTISGDGKVGVGTTTTTIRLCVVDGDIIDIKTY